MRELKFRAWEYSQSDKKWWSWIMSLEDIFYDDPIDGFDAYTWEQYTGLKDKNGKEIYEGDIVEARWYRAKHARFGTKGEVKFNNGWFYIKDSPDGEDRLGVPIHNCYDLEIIGNIHENPELLKNEEE